MRPSPPSCMSPSTIASATPKASRANSFVALDVVSARKHTSDRCTVPPLSRLPPASGYRCSMILYENGTASLSMIISTAFQQRRSSSPFAQRCLSPSVKNSRVRSRPYLPHLYHAWGERAVLTNARGLPALRLTQARIERHTIPRVGANACRL